MSFVPEAGGFPLAAAGHVGHEPASVALAHAAGIGLSLVHFGGSMLGARVRSFTEAMMRATTRTVAVKEGCGPSAAATAAGQAAARTP